MDLVYRCDPFAPVVARRIPDADAALRELDAGHRKYRRVVDHVRTMFEGDGAEPLILAFDPITYGIAMVEGSSVTQEPFALVLGCSDARVPTEQIFHQDNNDLFVVRVAGNVLGTECLGSIDYATTNMKSLKVVAVMGHTHCGAVTAAVDMYLSPTDYPDLGLSFALRSLVDRVMIGVRGAANALERVVGPKVSHDLGYRTALIELAVYLNTALTAYDIRKELGLGPERGIEVVHGVFDIVSQRVRCRIADGGNDAPMFAVAPNQAAEFDGLASSLALEILERGGIDPAFVERR